MISRTNTALAVMLVMVFLLAAVSGVDYSQPNVEVLADLSMKYTPASTPYEFSEAFTNGMTQQEPVPGTIARGNAPLYFVPLPDDVDPKTVAPNDSVPGKEVVNPVSLEVLLRQAILQSEQAATARERAVQQGQAKKQIAEAADRQPSEQAPDRSDVATAESQAPSDSGESSQAKESPNVVAQRQFQASIDRGNDIFLAFCICCHGPEGKGDGMVAQRGYPPPPSYLVGTSTQWNDGQLFHILTYGRLNMPKFAAELPRGSRWDVINYVRTLQTVGTPPVVDKQEGAATPLTDQLNSGNGVAREGRAPDSRENKTERSQPDANSSK